MDLPAHRKGWKFAYSCDFYDENFAHSYRVFAHPRSPARDAIVSMAEVKRKSRFPAERAINYEDGRPLLGLLQLKVQIRDRRSGSKQAEALPRHRIDVSV
jgi:hypothetical protein